MSEEIFDVIIQSTGSFRADVRTFQDNLPPKDFRLNDEFWIGSLPHDISPSLVFEACGPAGYNFRPTRQYGMRYAFCRRVRPDRSTYYAWDNDRTLGITVFLSRLIHPTTIANCYSARMYFDDCELKSIVAGPTQVLGAHAWLVAKDNSRDWLSVPECELLRDLASIYNTKAPDRVSRARRHIDHAFHTFYLDQRFASLVTSFESLLKVSPYKGTKQFATRVPKLAELLGFELTGSEAEAMYQDRSAFVHGDEVSFNTLNDNLIEQYQRFERVIRCALLRASTEKEFAMLFSSSNSVVTAFGA